MYYINQYTMHAYGFSDDYVETEWYLLRTLFMDEYELSADLYYMLLLSSIRRIQCTDLIIKVYR